MHGPIFATFYFIAMKIFTIFCLVALLANLPSIAQNPQLIQGIRISQIGGDMQADSLIVSARLYDRAGRLLSKLELIEEPNSYYVEKTYNPLSQVIKEEKRELDGSPIETLLFAYDFKGDLISREVQRLGGDTLRQNVYHIYGPENLLVKQIFANEENDHYSNYQTFTYDQENRIARTYFFAEKKLTREEAFTYNDVGQVTEHVIRYKNPALEIRQESQYRRGTLHEERKFINGILTSVSAYERDKKGELEYISITYPEKDKKDFLFFLTKSPTQPIQEEISRGANDSTTAEKP